MSEEERLKIKTHQYWDGTIDENEQEILISAYTGRPETDLEPQIKSASKSQKSRKRSWKLSFIYAVCILIIVSTGNPKKAYISFVSIELRKQRSATFFICLTGAVHCFTHVPRLSHTEARTY